MDPLQASALLAGLTGVAIFLSSVIRTVVIPRPERVFLTSSAFSVSRQAAHFIASRVGPKRRHRVLGAFAPTVLVALPLFWSIGLILSFTAIYWGLEAGTFAESLELSGSSLTTLGFVAAPSLGLRLLAILEALIGLAIVALMISFLPTIYGTFSRREIAVGRLTTRAGAPPGPISFVTRLHEIGRLDHIGERWEEWEDWFVELGETHTSFPALVHFRSADPNRSWVTAAETALDTAALTTAAGLAPRTGQADTMIRSGYLALRAIADYYRIAPEWTPVSAGTLSVSRSDFDKVLDALEGAGLSVTAERDEAWADFARWRIQYDQAITGLRNLVGWTPSHWSTMQNAEIAETEA